MEAHHNLDGTEGEAPDGQRRPRRDRERRDAPQTHGEDEGALTPHAPQLRDGYRIVLSFDAGAGLFCAEAPDVSPDAVVWGPDYHTALTAAEQWLARWRTLQAEQAPEVVAAAARSPLRLEAEQWIETARQQGRGAARQAIAAMLLLDRWGLLHSAGEWASGTLEWETIATFNTKALRGALHRAYEGGYREAAAEHGWTQLEGDDEDDVGSTW